LQVGYDTPYMSKTYTVLVGLLIIASFFIGKLNAQLEYMKKDTAAEVKPAQQNGTYQTFEEAMSAYASAVDIDGKKFTACLNSGEKAAVVKAEAAEAAALGISGTPAFFINGRVFGGAFPIESFREVIDRELAGTGSEDPSTYSSDLQSAAKQGVFDPVRKNVTVGKSHALGKGGSPVVIVEYSDFQCPYCVRAFPVIKQVLKEYGENVLYVYKHLPLDAMHSRAQKAAEAAECAADQGKFWEFHDQLLLNQKDWSSL